MAKTKQDYFAQGQADAAALKQRASFAAGNWQGHAYDQGYTAYVTDAQQKVVHQAKIAAAQQSKVWLDTQRRLKAEQDRNERLARIRGLTAKPVKRSDAIVSHNIIRPWFNK